MKTAVIWDECFGKLKLLVVDGDWSRFEGVMINDEDSSRLLRDELSALVYDRDSEFSVPAVTREEFAWGICQGAKFVTCGIVPWGPDFGIL